MREISLDDKIIERIQMDLPLLKEYLVEIELGYEASIFLMTINCPTIYIPEFNITLIIHDLINNNVCDYTLLDFINFQEVYDYKFGNFKDFTISILDNYVSSSSIVFLENTLNLYCNNFDYIINFLKPATKSLQLYYEFKNKKGKLIVVNHASQVLQVIEQFDNNFYNKLLLFMNLSLRNSKSHSDYKFELNNIKYKSDLKKTYFDRQISSEDLALDMFYMGLFINKLQYLQAKYKSKLYIDIIKNNISKENIISFCKSYLI